MNSLAGKTILITGASRGIGAAAAIACAAAGARVLAHASARGAAAAGLAAEAGIPEADMLYEDLSEPHAGLRLAERAIERAGRLHGLVNNAGIFRETALEGPLEAWDAGWDEQLAVNLRAPAELCRAGVAHFRAHRGGTVINVASRAGHRGDAMDFAGYAATKGAILALTKTWARALAPENILFYAIAPGWVETRMAPQDIEARKAALADIPLGRVADPEEVGALIAFLLSDACPSATGATFDVNGASYVR